MARIRSVKPEFFTHPEVVVCSIPARLLLVSVFDQADDEGRLYDQPKKILSNAFGEHDRVTVRLIDELVDRDRMCRYEVDGRACLHVIHFNDHQSISHPKPSVIPPCPLHADSGKAPGKLPEASGVEGKGGEGRGTGREGSKASPSVTPKRVGRPVDPLVKTVAAAWKAQLVAQGVTMLPQDWSLKACGVVGKALRAGLTPADLEDAFEWGREQPWFADKLHDTGKLGDLIAQWQQRKVKALAAGNGKWVDPADAWLAAKEAGRG